MNHLARLADQTLADPFDLRDEFRAALGRRNLRHGHLCVTNWIVASSGAVLLVFHPLLGWAACGGHVEADEHPRAAARRELFEETGLVVDRDDEIERPLFVHRTRVGGSTPHTHWNIAYGAVVACTPSVYREPGRPARWWTVDALPAYRPDDVDVGLQTLIAAWRQRIWSA